MLARKSGEVAINLNHTFTLSCHVKPGVPTKVIRDGRFPNIFDPESRRREVDKKIAR